MKTAIFRILLGAVAGVWLAAGVTLGVGAEETQGAGKETDQLFLVENKGKYGYIDRTGKIAVPLTFDHALPFAEGIAVVEEDGHDYAINIHGTKVKDFGRSQFIRRDGFCPTRFWDGFSMGDVPNGKAFYDHDWNQAFGRTFENASHFSNGLASVKIDGFWGVIDKTGKLVVSNQYDYVGFFSDGIAPAGINEQLGAKVGAINTTGEILVPLEYKYVGPYSFGLMPAMVDKGKWIFLDARGHQGIDKVFEAAFPFTEGKASVQIGGKFGFIDLFGHIVIKPLYERAYEFSEGLAAVWVDGKWGFINHHGKMVIKPQFDSLPNSGFMNGLAEVEVAGKRGYIDKRGDCIWEPTSFWE